MQSSYMFVLFTAVTLAAIAGGLAGWAGTLALGLLGRTLRHAQFGKLPYSFGMFARAPTSTDLPSRSS